MPKGSTKPSAGEEAIDGRQAPALDSVPGHRELVHYALAASGADSHSSATAAATALRALFVELEPLLGERAMRALYGRSLYLARTSFSPAVGMPVNGEDVFQPLLRNLAAREPSDAHEASETLLVMFSDLLITFLGEPIALQALRSAWGGTGEKRATRGQPE